MSIINDALRIAIYCQSAQTDADYIAYQREGVRKVIDRCTSGEVEVEHYSDDGLDVDRDARPGFQRLLADAAGGTIDCIAVTGWNRLAASELGVQMLARFFRKHGVLVVECRLREGLVVRLAA
ncbi:MULTISPECIES: recombinase family protein [unclassified Lysobacter]|uniref:recombinase family protein n=1 Tax=unclassified Lysobacter TaxID=2635362 RepID=UPI001BEBB69D|nr:MULTISPECIES: recombinase family protein [unclassified Lysobacter]MBT2748381.1 recombinase family protein [Lysobacter sp. ISL-42]MBT2749852.1 recombinase family protein [Lysobacter sp. ISL-50]MBT2781180.1 recombinase family protein [Lysobacter sp. ISL-52]